MPKSPILATLSGPAQRQPKAMSLAICSSSRMLQQDEARQDVQADADAAHDVVVAELAAWTNREPLRFPEESVEQSESEQQFEIQKSEAPLWDVVEMVTGAVIAAHPQNLSFIDFTERTVAESPGKKKKRLSVPLMGTHPPWRQPTSPMQMLGTRGGRDEGWDEEDEEEEEEEGTDEEEEGKGMD
ncbi:hypothetical protein EYF80_005600 [Liparis tanakae]|uniref:Uncharacterized protein n=1 Tax=Liparis tanakae TaxID=230148 RepID=A0A4Z2J455_9TELE|nr:hypothetical protein EYF80_005600 [Liparis tanakae]